MWTLRIRPSRIKTDSELRNFGKTFKLPVLRGPASQVGYGRRNVDVYAHLVVVVYYCRESVSYEEEDTYEEEAPRPYMCVI